MIRWADREVLPLAELPAPTLDPDQVRQVVERILARPEYRENEPGLLQQIFGFLAEWIGRLLEVILGAGRTGPLGLVVLLALVAAVTVLVLRFVSGVRRSAVRDAELAAGVGRSPQEWEAEAEEHEQAGRWGAALRCRYRQMLAMLAAQGLVDEIPGRTSGEYLAEAVANLPAAQADLAAVTAAFERVWYGNEPVGGEGVREVAVRVDRLGRAARGRRPSLAGASAGDRAT